MLQHRLSKFGNAALVAFCMLFTGSFMQSCNDELFDDYKYDDEYPGWLGASIYDFLNEDHDGRTYKNFIAIIDSLGENETLSRTGSKTLFVADDATFEKFFQNNRWGVTSFEELTKAQMKILLYSSMLDNAYILDMMSSLPASGSNDVPVEGSCLRRETSSNPVDSIPYFASDMLPKVSKFNNYWERFRAENGGNGLLLSLDGEKPMMVHFLREYMKSKAITSKDVNIIFNAKDRSMERSGDEAFIYQNQILSSGIDYGEISDDTLTITCKNGYIYRMDGVLVPPMNMAEELRLHPDTKIFSYLINRFSLPLYSQTLSNTYNTLNGNIDAKDSVFVLRYLNASGKRPVFGLSTVDNVITSEPTSKPEGYGTLLFDPGMNQYSQQGQEAAGDMAAIFAPTDASIIEYFAKGTGKFLIEQYSDPEVVEHFRNDISMENIATEREYMIKALDSIPNDIIAAFVNNLMQTSFSTSVPSKFGQVYNDGDELMFDDFPGADKSDAVKECVVANNGVIYILNHVFGPAQYRSVSAPPLSMRNMTIMKEAIEQLGYNSYLLAMDATYSFIVPDDNYFIYYDPVTTKYTNPVALQFFYNNKYDGRGTGGNKLWAKVWSYDPATYELKDSVAPNAEIGKSAKYPSGDGSTKTLTIGNGWSDGNLFYNRLTDLLEYLIIVGDVEDGNQYYQSKGYGTIKCNVRNTTDEGLDITFEGGLQRENGLPVKVAARYPEDNGVTYCTMSLSGDTAMSGVPLPPTESVSYKLDPFTSVNDQFDEFYRLCYGHEDFPINDISAPASDEEGELGGFFYNMYPELRAKAKLSQLKDTAQRYSIFYGSTSSTTGSNIPMYEAVPFFSTYHYTVYVPTNDAVKAVYEMGLPTWDEIITELEDTLNRPKVASYVRLINKFARYHFQDNAVYVDKNPFSVNNAGVPSSTANYETAALDDATGRFFETTVTSVEGLGGTHTLGIIDDLGNNIKVLNTPGEEGKSWNIMARDLLVKCSGSNNPQLATTIETSSFAVIHQIDKAMLNSGLIGYDGMFRRYARDGEFIDTMRVVGGKGSVAGDADAFADNCYLVARLRNNVVVTDTLGNESYKCVAYLMKPTGRDGKMDKEEYVLDANGEKILINNDGYLIKEKITTNSRGDILKIEYKFVDKDGNTSYVTEEGEEVEYTEGQVRVNNLGAQI